LPALNELVERRKRTADMMEGYQNSGDEDEIDVPSSQNKKRSRVTLNKKLAALNEEDVENEGELEVDEGPREDGEDGEDVEDVDEEDREDNDLSAKEAALVHSFLPENNPEDDHLSRGRQLQALQDLDEGEHFVY
jgi:hypothetical protein